ncbi:small subunit ribosomal protein S1 [Streptomyces griseochromogenes]|uniref:Small subunit ribosomal protein S1 n=1 Tax=Streptomyces griseochromogenes TaxID=68214 RepID=A0ABS4M1Y2_9ACTN|nr:S1 RNA-binding domain-containing protein [Streptomyces griseochromogenes]MBP2053684.1 small subunit ribosomal protein S1 [Streptomyces griseochromogenes]
MNETTPDPLEQLRERLSARPEGEVRTGTVVGFDEQRGVRVRLDGDDPQAPRGTIPRHLLTWAAFEDPSEVVSLGERITAEVQGVDERTGEVALSARACEDEALYRHLCRTRRGDVVTGTVAAVHGFGVFVRLDGEPAHPVHPGTGFVRVPELTWSPIDHPEEVVRPGQRVTGEVIDVDTYQGEVVVSLKALQEDPWDRLALGEGDVTAGPVTKVVPFGVFVRVGEAAEGLVHESCLGGRVVLEGQEMRVRILEIDRRLRRIRLAPAF